MQQTQTSLTKEQVVLQFMENTGRHLLDSGDYYGRGWERAQKEAQAVLGKEQLDLTAGSPDLRRLAEAYDHQYVGHMDWQDLDATINLYHWIVSQFEFDPRVQDWFDQFVEQQDEQKDLGVWSNYAYNFPLWLEGQHYDPETWELAPEGENERSDQLISLQYVLDGKVWSAYTYNHENWLSRDIIITAFKFDAAIYCGIQLHNGCDARGGLTKPRFYQHMGDSEYGFAEWQGGSVCCTSDATDGQFDERHYWAWGGSWGYRGGWGLGLTELEEFEAQDIAEFDEQELQEFWQSVIGFSRQHPTFDPHELWKWVKDAELPGLANSLTQARGTIWEETPAYVMEDHLRALMADEQADELTQLYRRILHSVWTTDDQRLGVRFYDSDENIGYCPICGGRLEFYPEQG